jgi:hypothetical protein
MYIITVAHVSVFSFAVVFVVVPFHPWSGQLHGICASSTTSIVIAVGREGRSCVRIRELFRLMERGAVEDVT